MIRKENRSIKLTRPIDAVQLRQKLHEAGGCGAEPDRWADGWDKGINEAIRLVEAAPTISRESLKPTGEWVPIAEKDEFGYVFCSRCGDKWTDEAVDAGFLRYCPHCGAQMGG